MIANGASVGVAMFSLVTFYIAVRKDLSQYNPVLQFFSIKFVIFFSVWQAIAIKVLTNLGRVHGTEKLTVAQVSTAIQSFLTCIEMCVAAVLHLHAFPYEDYQKPFRYDVGGDSDEETEGETLVEPQPPRTGGRNLRSRTDDHGGSRAEGDDGADERDALLSSNEMENALDSAPEAFEILGFRRAVLDVINYFDIWWDVLAVASFLRTRFGRSPHHVPDEDVRITVD
ncbi:hypothetical protein HK102_004009 [Quaeritorhiza haematococci]|nr:hypothetical protein HK102_004009 [Quaeritorhiza haematococci]